MGLFSNKISRDDLKPGDHIYSWRAFYGYSHHGIYVSDKEVIHFTRGGGLESGTGTFLDNLIVSSVPKHGDNNNPCLICGNQSCLDGVISSCLDCFLAGGNLYLFEYGVSKAFFMAKPRGGTCTTASLDPPSEVVSRAKYLLSENGFGAYKLLTNNCEDFAIFCKTGLVGLSKLGSSGQAHSAYAARNVFSSSLVKIVPTGSAAVTYFVSSAARFAVNGAFGGLSVAAAYGNYCYDRLNSDIGVRKDVTKVSAERLVEVVAILEGRSDDDDNDKKSC